MDIYKYGSSQTPVVLIQMVGEHDLPGIEREIMEIRRLTDMEFQLIAVKVNNWNQDLSPLECSGGIWKGRIWQWRKKHLGSDQKAMCGYK